MQFNKLSNQRILSIDALRGITIFVMIFVNELAGMRDIPAWMKHMHADDDAMSFVDVVFPAFLFIVGMSIPFAINSRLAKGETFLNLQKHILLRTAALLILGFFLVNAEDDYNEQLMGISINLWLLIFFAAVILTWKVYTSTNKIFEYSLRAVGLATLFFLAFIYRKENGEYISQRWWGILGLIGWAYLYACIFYQLFKGNKLLLILLIAFCSAWYGAAHTTYVLQNAWLSFIPSQSGNAAHTSIVLCGIVVTLIFFDEQKSFSIQTRFINAFLFAALLFMAGYFLRPYYQISKIHATPTWCLYSAAIYTLLFAFLYWIIDIKKMYGWTNFFKPAAANPLLTYIIPDFIYALTGLFGITLWPDSLCYGLPAIFWCIIYAVAVLYITRLLQKINLRLHL